MSVRKYQESHVSTASPMELVMMLYDEAIKSLDKAESAFGINDPSRIEQIGNNLLHAQDVITELAVSLDMEKGGEIAHQLQRLYDFMVHHLSKADVSKDLKGIKEVRKMLSDLREAWGAVAQKEVVANEPAREAMANNTISVTG
ncbi:MAG: flagellar export chaperone FliS [bacterium]